MISVLNRKLERLALFVFFQVLLLNPSSSKAADFLENSFGSRSASPRLSYTGTLQPSGFRMQSQEYSLQVPVVQNFSHSFSVGSKGSYLTNSQEVYQLNGIKVVPKELSSFDVEMNYTRFLENQKFIGTSLALGSASDQIFSRPDVSTLSSSVFYSFPHGNFNRWILSLFYSNNTPFLPGVPIPGFMYIYGSPKLFILAGFPVFNFKWKPTDEINITGSILGTVGQKVQFHYRINPDSDLFTGFDWDQKTWFMRERESSDQRLFLSEKKVFVGYKASIGPATDFDMKAGYSYDRSYFNSSGLLRNTENIVNLAASWFLSSSFNVKF